MAFIKTCLGLVLFLAAPAHAQDKRSTPPSSDTVLNTMTRKLNLTDDQRAKLTPILADRQEKLQAVRDDTGDRPRIRMGKARNILRDSDKQINAILTPDQQKTYKQLEDARMAKMKANRRSGNNTDDTL